MDYGQYRHQCITLYCDDIGVGENGKSCSSLFINKALVVTACRRYCGSYIYSYSTDRPQECKILYIVLITYLIYLYGVIFFDLIAFTEEILAFRRLLQPALYGKAKNVCILI